MRDETRKKLDDQRSLDRWIARTLGVIIELIWVLPSRNNGEVVATVTLVRASIHQDTPRIIVNFDVDLDDGRHVMAASSSARAPNVGQRIILRETTDWIGYHKFRWDALTPRQPKATP